MTPAISNSDPPRRAVVLGATGLVGQQLLKLLTADPKYEQITLLVRRPLESSSPKWITHVIDFERPEQWQPHITGDVLFSCLGTTINVAKTKDAQFRVDHDYPLWAAQAAAKNGVSNYVLISSTGANAKSRIFYSRIKGQLEDAVAALDFKSCNILRPGILDGKRTENRPAERLTLKVLRKVPAWVLPPSARPSPVIQVAQACLNADQLGKRGVHFIEAAQILEARVG